jgi:tetratricopeptide (TPR) repeat protein
VKPEKVVHILMVMSARSSRRLPVGVVALAMGLLVAAPAGAVPDGSFWGKVGGPARAASDRDAGDIAKVLERADSEESAGRLDAACALLERALPRYTGAERAAAWFRLGIVRTRQGRYREAATAYAAVVADGTADAAVYANFAEVLMASGRLSDAEARYRDAIAAASDLGAGDRRERVHELALAYYGLAVALDRDEQPAAAREAMQRALANDPTAAMLKIASSSGGDLFFVPDGDVLYYIGLAAEVEGRDGDAEAAFREFIERSPRGRWLHAAEAHLAQKNRTATAPAKRAGPGSGEVAARIVGFGTVLATGGIPAPLVDATWRDRLPILDECLAELRLPPHSTMRIAIEMDVDARGKPTRVIVKAPPPHDERFAHCVESVAKQRLHFSVPSPSRATIARTEMVLGTP